MPCPRHRAPASRPSPARPGVPEAFYRAAGYHLCGPRAIRIDILERLADLIRPLLAWRAKENGQTPPKGSSGDGGFIVTPEMMSILGCSADELSNVLKALGFRVERKTIALPAAREGPAVKAAETPSRSRSTAPISWRLSSRPRRRKSRRLRNRDALVPVDAAVEAAERRRCRRRSGRRCLRRRREAGTARTARRATRPPRPRPRSAEAECRRDDQEVDVWRPAPTRPRRAPRAATNRGTVRGRGPAWPARSGPSSASRTRPPTGPASRRAGGHVPRPPWRRQRTARSVHARSADRIARSIDVTIGGISGPGRINVPKVAIVVRVEIATSGAGRRATGRGRSSEPVHPVARGLIQIRRLPRSAPCASNSRSRPRSRIRERGLPQERRRSTRMEATVHLRCGSTSGFGSLGSSSRGRLPRAWWWMGGSASIGRKSISRANPSAPGTCPNHWRVGDRVRILKVVAMGSRRGPATEAKLLFEDLTPPATNAPRNAEVPSREPGSGRPTKRDRRLIDRLTLDDD